MQGLVGWLEPAGCDATQRLQTLLGERAAQVLPGARLFPDAGLANWAGRSDHAEDGETSLVIVGQPHLTGIGAPAGSLSRTALELWRSEGLGLMGRLHGSFALALIDRRDQSVFLAIDRMGCQSLAYAAHARGIVFSDRADTVARHPAVQGGLDPQGLFNYFYFYDLPAPGTVFRGVSKLLPGQWLRWRKGRMELGYYWRLHYRDEPRTDFDAQAARFHALLRECVARAKGEDEVAAFLSGGTDSSTVAGVLTEVQGRPARTYSIGFAAQGFDEMEYARIAARHFGLDAREYYLRPEDILEAIPVIARHYDEPFANESAVPTLFCARLAASDGYRVMLAGDGGDEIFGGNARYAKQKVFEAYHALPPLLRTGLIEPLARLPGLDRLPPVRKLHSYIRQANIPLPERMESYNFIYRQPLEAMFSRELLAQVDTHLPAVWLKDAYDRADSESYINRMLHLDLKFTLADNDLRKVGGMTEAAGVEVRYPLLDDEMVAFSGEVPPDWKVKGRSLRWFFKTALKGYLPDAIIHKTKHGFGLPFGLWAREHAPLRERVEERLAAFARRGLLNPAYIEQLRREHMSGHATYFGKMIWVILTLEEWLAARGL